MDAHRQLWSARREPWTPATAYRWLRYEDPDPLARLGEGVERLAAIGARFDPGLVAAAEDACARAAAAAGGGQ